LPIERKPKPRACLNCPENQGMSRLSLTRTKIYNTVARQLHGQVPCWVCGQHVTPEDATLEHIRPQSEGGSSHLENLAISHGTCNRGRHIPQQAA
jgi:5-methylcytosine-specific restriction endonuclease McrA